MKRAIAVLISLLFIISAFSLSALSVSANESEPLPESYNSNPYNLRYITSVKSQGNYGNCWAFAAIACCEAEAVKNHGASIHDTNLSELHLAYFSYNGMRDTGDTVTSVSNFYDYGGFSHLPIYTFSGWIGLVDESVAKYSSFTSNPSIKLDESLMYGNAKYYLTNAYTYSLPNDIDKVKNAILTYGAVETAYYSSDYYLNYSPYSPTFAQYCPEEKISDHAVTIVGWDDNYSRNNFKSSARPEKNGAWLVKNSWGDNWGINGYFWLSYEDKSVVSATAFDVTPAENFAYDNNYQHDGGIASTYSNNTTTYAANIFTAKNEEKLTAIGVTTYIASNSDYTVKIYLNPKELSPKKFNADAPIYTQTGKISEAGFSTIKLNTTITLRQDDVFIILIETVAKLALDGDQTIKNGNTVLVNSDASVLPNQTYFSVNGTDFYDASSTSSVTNPFNARIKAFTENIAIGHTLFQELPTVSAIKYGQPLNAATISGGKIVDSLSKNDVRGSWSFKTPDAIVKNGDTVKLVFTPANSAYTPVERSITVTVEETTPELIFDTDKKMYKPGETVKVSASIKNPYNDTLKDLPTVKFYYQINDGEKVFFNDSIVIPEDLWGNTLIIAAITDGVSGKYASVIKTQSFSAPALPPELDTDASTEATNGNSASESVSDTESSDSESSSDTQTETSVTDEIVNGGKSGCFSALSLHAILIVGSMMGTAVLKKKQND